MKQKKVVAYFLWIAIIVGLGHKANVRPMRAVVQARHDLSATRLGKYYGDQYNFLYLIDREQISRAQMIAHLPAQLRQAYAAQNVNLNAANLTVDAFVSIWGPVEIANRAPADRVYNVIFHPDVMRWHNPDPIHWNNNDINVNILAGIFAPNGVTPQKVPSAISFNSFAKLNVHKHRSGEEQQYQNYSPDNAHFKIENGRKLVTFWTAALSPDKKKTVIAFNVIIDDSQLSQTLISSLEHATDDAAEQEIYQQLIDGLQGADRAAGQAAFAIINRLESGGGQQTDDRETINQALERAKNEFKATQDQLATIKAELEERRDNGGVNRAQADAIIIAIVFPANPTRYEGEHKWFYVEDLIEYLHKQGRSPVPHPAHEWVFAHDMHDIPNLIHLVSFQQIFGTCGFHALANAHAIQKQIDADVPVEKITFSETKRHAEQMFQDVLVKKYLKDLEQCSRAGNEEIGRVLEIAADGTIAVTPTTAHDSRLVNTPTGEARIVPEANYFVLRVSPEHDKEVEREGKEQFLYSLMHNVVTHFLVLTPGHFTNLSVVKEGTEYHMFYLNSLNSNKISDGAQGFIRFVYGLIREAKKRKSTGDTPQHRARELLRRKRELRQIEADAKQAKEIAKQEEEKEAQRKQQEEEEGRKLAEELAQQEQREALRKQQEEEEGRKLAEELAQQEQREAKLRVQEQEEADRRLAEELEQLEEREARHRAAEQ